MRLLFFVMPKRAKSRQFRERFVGMCRRDFCICSPAPIGLRHVNRLLNVRFRRNSQASRTVRHQLQDEPFGSGPERGNPLVRTWSRKQEPLGSETSFFRHMMPTRLGVAARSRVQSLILFATRLASCRPSGTRTGAAFSPSGCPRDALLDWPTSAAHLNFHHFCGIFLERTLSSGASEVLAVERKSAAGARRESVGSVGAQARRQRNSGFLSSRCHGVGLLAEELAHLLELRQRRVHHRQKCSRFLGLGESGVVDQALRRRCDLGEKTL